MGYAMAHSTVGALFYCRNTDTFICLGVQSYTLRAHTTWCLNDQVRDPQDSLRSLEYPLGRILIVTPVRTGMLYIGGTFLQPQNCEMWHRGSPGTESPLVGDTQGHLLGFQGDDHV